jgi:hypothetical protein
VDLLVIILRNHQTILPVDLGYSYYVPSCA